MAGIGFKLKEILKRDTYFSLIGAISYAGIISSGPWIIAIFAIFGISFIAGGNEISTFKFFQAIVVYSIAGSLISSSFFQYSYTRFISDYLFTGRDDEIIPSLNGVYFIQLCLSLIIGCIAVSYFLSDLSLPIRIVSTSNFIVLNLIWVSTCVLSGVLAFHTIAFVFLGNYLLIFMLAYFLQLYGLLGLLVSFFIGQSLILIMLTYAIYDQYPSRLSINFNFFKLKSVKLTLIFAGFFYSVGIWADKFIFWFSNKTGMVVVGNLQASIVYDTPIFLAYLAVIPGMILFFMRLEMDYAFAHKDLFQKIKGDYTLSEIQSAHQQLIIAGRTTIYDIAKLQLYILFFSLCIGSTAFTLLNISLAYFPLFYICTVAASLNIFFWAILDIIFYLDELKLAMYLTLIFAFTNILFTTLSIYLGVFYFGYGLIASLLLTVIIAFFILNHITHDLVRRTYSKYSDSFQS